MNYGIVITKLTRPLVSVYQHKYEKRENMSIKTQTKGLFILVEREGNEREEIV